MVKHFTHWDSADYLDTEEDIQLYLDACMEEDPGDGRLIRHALSSILRARNQSELVRQVGVSREGLRKTLSAKATRHFLSC